MRPDCGSGVSISERSRSVGAAFDAVGLLQLVGELIVFGGKKLELSGGARGRVTRALDTAQRVPPQPGGMVQRLVPDGKRALRAQPETS